MAGPDPAGQRLPHPQGRLRHPLARGREAAAEDWLPDEDRGAPLVQRERFPSDFSRARRTRPLPSTPSATSI